MGEGTSGSAHLAVPVVGQLQQCLVLLAEVHAQLCQQVGGCQVVPRHPRLLCLHRTQRLQPPRTRMTGGRQTGSRRPSCPAPRAPAQPPAGHPGGPASCSSTAGRRPELGRAPALDAALTSQAQGRVPGWRWRGPARQQTGRAAAEGSAACPGTRSRQRGPRPAVPLTALAWPQFQPTEWPAGRSEAAPTQHAWARLGVGKWTMQSGGVRGAQLSSMAGCCPALSASVQRPHNLARSARGKGCRLLFESSGCM